MAWGSNTSGWGSTPAPKTNGRKQTDTEMELSKREAEIKERERQLEQQQRELQTMQRSGTGGRTPVKNWPPCSPILYHDIDAEIPVALQSTVKRAYQAYLLFCLTVVYNFLCLTLSLVKSGDIVAWIFAGIYVLAGVPGAFIIWYGRIYNAASYDRAITFMCYFLGSAIHVGFCVWASIPVPLTTLGGDESSFAGFLEVFDKFDKAQWLGVFYLLGFVLWVGNAALSIFVWQQAMRDFRGRGGPQQVQSQAQAAAGRAVLSAATNPRV